MPTWRCRRVSSSLHLLPQLQVERAERLVEQQHRRPVDERARERDALALAAAELARAPLLVAVERDHLQHLERGTPALGLRHLLHAQAELDVVGHAHVREERVALEHGVDRARMGRDVLHRLAVDQQRAARWRVSKPPIRFKRRRLAAAARAEQREELALARSSGRCSSSAIVVPNRLVTPRSSTAGGSPARGVPGGAAALRRRGVAARAGSDALTTRRPARPGRPCRGRAPRRRSAAARTSRRAARSRAR